MIVIVLLRLYPVAGVRKGRGGFTRVYLELFSPSQRMNGSEPCTHNTDSLQSKLGLTAWYGALVIEVRVFDNYKLYTTAHPLTLYTHLATDDSTNCGKYYKLSSVLPLNDHLNAPHSNI